MNEYQWIDKIQERIERQELPGRDAHLKMSSVGREQRVAEASLQGAKHSAVTIMLYQKEGHWHIPLIRRPSYNGVHGGQMGLPGGKLEEEDPSLRHTALRETHEEVGVYLGEQHIIGGLSELYIPPSHLLVRPYLAIAHEPPAFSPDPQEVAELFEMPLRDFFRPDTRQQQQVTVMGNMRMKVPAFYVQEQTIWGATAMMLNELFLLIEELDLQKNLRLYP